MLPSAPPRHCRGDSHATPPRGRAPASSPPPLPPPLTIQENTSRGYSPGGTPLTPLSATTTLVASAPSLDPPVWQVPPVGRLPIRLGRLPDLPGRPARLPSTHLPVLCTRMVGRRGASHRPSCGWRRSHKKRQTPSCCPSARPLYPSHPGSIRPPRGCHHHRRHPSLQPSRLPAIAEGRKTRVRMR